MFCKNKIHFPFIIALVIFLNSCSSLKQPKSIQQPLDYTDEDIVLNEIERIDALLEKEPVRALWRSILLGNKPVIDKCTDVVVQRFENALEQKNYFEAKKYFTSLSTSGWKNEKYSLDSVNRLYSQDVPGFGKNNLAPKNISECMNGTVTVWIDRGLKVQNGAGYADIVIGSGFFIDKRGYLVTNHHVIESMVDSKYEGYSRLYVKLFEDPDTKIPAKVIGYDAALDMALLKTEIVPKTVLNLGSSKELNIGDKISAIGTPVGLEGTLTSGIISSTERKLLTLGNVFQIDAAVNSGNSGGPLIDNAMKVQAIVFAGMPKYQGLNFAIPVEYLKQELNLMYSCGEVIHPWIGCYGHTKRQGKNKAGLEIQYVLPGGSASMAGLVPGDTIVKVDGTVISSLEDFQYILMGYEAETLLKCEYIDASENQKSAYLYLDKRPEKPAVVIYESDFIANSFVPLFGMKMVPSSTLNKNSYTIENVIKGTAADELNFSEFDTVTVKDVKIDAAKDYIVAQIYARRRKKGLLDVTMAFVSQLDNPYYF